MGLVASEWEKKRKWSFINFCVGHFIYGLSVGIYFCTEYYYFKETQHVSNPAVLYGIAEGCFFAGGILFSLIGAVYFDHFNRVRNITLQTAILCTLGNILYLCYISPILVLLGQFLIGMVVGWAVVSVAEVRQYEYYATPQSIFINDFSLLPMGVLLSMYDNSI